MADASNALHNNIDEKATGVRGAVDEARKSMQDAIEDTKSTVDGTERLEALAARLEQVTGRLNDLTTRLDTVEDGFTEKIAEHGRGDHGQSHQGRGHAGQAAGQRPGGVDGQEEQRGVRAPHRRPPGRGHGHVRGADDGRRRPQPRPPATLPRQTARRRNGKPQKTTRTEETEDADASSS